MILTGLWFISCYLFNSVILLDYFAIFLCIPIKILSTRIQAPNRSKSPSAFHLKSKKSQRFPTPRLIIKIDKEKIGARKQKSAGASICHECQLSAVNCHLSDAAADCGDTSDCTWGNVKLKAGNPLFLFCDANVRGVILGVLLKCVAVEGWNIKRVCNILDCLTAFFCWIFSCSSVLLQVS